MAKREAPPAPEDPMGPLIESLEAVTLGKYMAVVAITIIIYDTILTYDREVSNALQLSEYALIVSTVP
ncbi:hypothetical protein FRC08_013653 [Ceratobasidium sp. 394]|nr:hypothetical protein FRC08_013653 [Ceratobasidium sp. 394]KAG9097563.1 hypothetical protein FS749_006012 [Ceratobasidium sp. UAMH 11750]